MPSAPVFISHASSDDAFVRALRQALENLKFPSGSIPATCAAATPWHQPLLRLLTRRVTCWSF